MNIEDKDLLRDYLSGESDLVQWLAEEKRFMAIDARNWLERVQVKIVGFVTANKCIKSQGTALDQCSILILHLEYIARQRTDFLGKDSTQ